MRSMVSQQVGVGVVVGVAASTSTSPSPTGSLLLRHKQALGTKDTAHLRTSIRQMVISTPLRLVRLRY